MTDTHVNLDGKLREHHGRSCPSPARRAGARRAPEEGVRVITFGTFDLFHVGHLQLLRRARAAGDWLVVGVSTDALTWQRKGRRPVFPLEHRLALVAGSRFVDDVFVEESLEARADYIRRYRAHTLVMGADWTGHFDDLSSLCRVVYLPRTPRVSSSAIRTVLRAAC